MTAAANTRDPGADAIIVGAGPAGSSAAFHLARKGRRVLLLDKQTFPRDKSCGDGLTRSAMAHLQEMGLLGKLSESRKIRGVRMVMRGKGSREFDYPKQPDAPDFGLVVRRYILDDLLLKSAVDHGAAFWKMAHVENLLLEKNRVVGVEVTHENQRKFLRSRVVIAADGAASKLAYQAGLAPTPKEDLGVALRGYFDQLTGLSDHLEIYAPLLDVSDRYLLPSYGWVFPIDSTTANVGVGLFQRDHGANVNELFQRFINELRKVDGRFSNARLCGTTKGAPLRFDFSPAHCARDGLFLAGDAAGMISPFTGEGISNALESGRIAARVIEESLAAGNGPPDCAEYSRLLGASYAGS